MDNDGRSCCRYLPLRPPMVRATAWGLGGWVVLGNGGAKISFQFQDCTGRDGGMGCGIGKLLRGKEIGVAERRH